MKTLFLVQHRHSNGLQYAEKAGRQAAPERPGNQPPACKPSQPGEK
jgi:hypothetical protein